MSVEYTPLSPAEIQELRIKEARGDLTPEDTRRFIESTRAKFKAIPTKEEGVRKPRAPKEPPKEQVDFF